MNTCETCKFLHEEGINKETMRKHYTCRRYPPTPQMVPGQGGVVTVGMFPPTQAQLWCGEWQPKLALSN
jgi:hypothetical protein